MTANLGLKTEEILFSFIKKPLRGDLGWYPIGAVISNRADRYIQPVGACAETRAGDRKCDGLHVLPRRIYDQLPRRKRRPERMDWREGEGFTGT